MDVAIFTEEVAKGLVEKGFELVAKTNKAWYFEDSVWLRIAVDELLESVVDDCK